MFHWLRGLAERFSAQKAETVQAGRPEAMPETFRAVGGCRCDNNPVRYAYTKRPFETHFCCCTDCTDICGGALALIAVVERDAFQITSGESKIRNYDTKATCHRRFCSDCSPLRRRSWPSPLHRSIPRSRVSRGCSTRSSISPR